MVQFTAAVYTKERTFEYTFVITLRKRRRKAKSGAPQSKKAKSPAPTAKTRKRKPAKTSGNGKTTTVQAGDPKDKIFKLVAQVPGQVKKPVRRASARLAPHSNTEQRNPPDLPAGVDECTAYYKRTRRFPSWILTPPTAAFDSGVNISVISAKHRCGKLSMGPCYSINTNNDNAWRS